MASLLNVLDRCDDPHSILNASTEAVAIDDDGLVLIGTVLPFRPIVHEGKLFGKFGRAHSRQPRNPLKLQEQASSLPFEPALSNFLETVLREHPKLELVQWTRLPYVSSGDTRKTHYTMDMALLAFRISKIDRVSISPTNESPDSIASAATTVSETSIDACRNKRDDEIYAWLAESLSYEEGFSGNWGSVLDAGAGFSSMCWLLRQQHSRITEVTSTKNGIYGSSDLAKAAAGINSVVIASGNWKDVSFLQHEMFDVVVADYLLGAVEMHWPHGADGVMDRLLNATKPNGYLLIAGLEPYEVSHFLQNKLVFALSFNSLTPLSSPAKKANAQQKY